MRQEYDVAHLLVKTHDGRCFTDQRPHPLREVGTQRVEFVAEGIVKKFGEFGVFAFDIQLTPKVCIGDMDHRLVFPYFWTEQPAIDHLFRGESFVGAFPIDGLQKIQGKGRERAKTAIPYDLLAGHFFGLVGIDGLDAAGVGIGN